MVRSITYDPVAVRRNLLEVFWTHGYAETSLSDLEEATGLNRRQLYNGPGDKTAMFVQALDDFTESAGRQFLSALEAETAGLDAIEELLNRFVALAGRDDVQPTGCLVCSTSQDEIATEDKVRQRIDAYFARIEGAYRNALAQAAGRGEITLSEAEIDNRSALLFGVHVALCILARAKAPHVHLQRMAEEALNTLR